MERSKLEIHHCYNAVGGTCEMLLKSEADAVMDAMEQRIKELEAKLKENR